MRVSLFTDTYIPQVNGVARTLHRFVNHLERRGIPYQLFVPESIEKENPFASNIHAFTSFPFFLYPECRLAVPNIIKLRQRLETFKPDLIHITTPFNIGLTGLYYGKKYHIPMVGSYHTHFDHYLRYYKLLFMSDMLWKYVKWFYSGFEKTFVPSLETKEHLLNKGFNSVDLWKRGVDCSLYNPNKQKPSTSKSKYTLIYVGRIAPEKDMATLRKIIRQLPREMKRHIEWVIVGDGPLLSEMKEEFNSESVTFTGYLQGEELAAVYASADLFIFPSTTETFGNVVLESLASGTPAIVSNQGGVREIVEHNKTGIVCDAKSPTSFINAITDLIQHPNKRRHFAQQARSYALTQSWEAIFDQLLLQYEHVAFINNKKKHLA
ncbi:glycosyltransferase family 1 protein [Halalkalibacter sp. APA_J-10(15)]|uniref:glycosyltransferase family 4 protein n=1 Tax=unclassified Halalkalibacter TaxID=2893063 RepID=UPI001FF52705|nr:glycosyltransferase family 1 protein [Halalkalibacter sp. APA_J-10(15)]MCK0471250.1 glycosyltransferase family 1 protein [Halalkalibacter sp. APA_J-10(15)]